MMTQGTLVRLDKVAQQNAGPLPATYWLEGAICETPTVGHTLRVVRSARARQRPEEPERVDCLGLYVSSPVKELIQNDDGSILCRTMNSVWRISLCQSTSEENHSTLVHE